MSAVFTLTTLFFLLSKPRSNASAAMITALKTRYITCVLFMIRFGIFPSPQHLVDHGKQSKQQNRYHNIDKLPHGSLFVGLLFVKQAKRVILCTGFGKSTGVDQIIETI